MASFKKRKTDRYGYVWDVQFIIKRDGKRVQKTLYGYRTREEASEARDKYLVNHRPEELPDPRPVVPLREAYEAYLSEKEEKVTSQTLRQTKNIFEKHILPVFGKKPVNGLTPSDVITWQDDVRAKPRPDGRTYSQGEYREICSAFRAFEAWAGEAYGFTSPFADLKIPNKDDSEKDVRQISEDEFAAAVRRIPEDEGRLFYTLIYCTGAKLAEINALTGGDFVKQGERYTLKITKSLRHENGTGMVQVGYGGHFPERDVALPLSLTLAIDAFLSGKDDKRVWKWSGEFFSPEFKKSQATCGAHVITPSDLRMSHTAALLSAGVPLPVVAKRLAMSENRLKSDFHPGSGDASLTNALERLYAGGVPEAVKEGALKRYLPAEPRKVRVVTTDEFRTVYEKTPKTKFKVLFSVVYFTGCFPAEVQALLAEDFTKRGKRYSVNITKLVRDHRNTYLETVPCPVPRKIPLPFAMTPLLDTFLEGKTGKLWEMFPSSVNADFRTALKKTGLGGFSLISFRMSHQAVLLSSGVPAKDVAKRLGLMNERVLLWKLSAYVNPGDANLLEVIDALAEEVFS